MASDHVKLNPSAPLAKRPENLRVNLKARPLRKGVKASVWQAHDQSLGRDLHYVLLDRDLGADEAERQAFTTRAQLLAQLEHPYIVPIHGAGMHREGGKSGRKSVYLVMKQVEGRTLAEATRAKDFKGYSRKEIYAFMQVFLKVCDAVHFAHSRSVIHRTLSPETIQLGDHGEVYVVGWEDALLSSSEVESPSHKKIVGMPAYLSPELAAGMEHRADPRSDVFALGACLYELLTGAAPFGEPGASREVVLQQAVRCEPVPPQQRADCPLPMYLCRIVTKAMARAPEERYQTAKELKEDIECFLQTHSFFPQVNFEPGSLIVREGEFGDAAYIIIDGKAEVHTTVDEQKKSLRTLTDGDTFGEIAVFSGRPRTANVQAITPVTAIRITQEQLRNEDGLGYWLNLFNKALAERFVEKEKEVSDLEERLRCLNQW